MPIIHIGTTVIQFPDSGTSPNWAPAVIDFAVAVQDALSGFVGPADVFPQIFVIDALNPGTAVPIPNLTFSNTIVRAAFIRYAIYRTAGANSASEVGTLNIVYNNATNTWESDRSYAGDGLITFTITSQGQVELNTLFLAGGTHAGKFVYAAQALLQN
jgi:hypothetical protein